MVQKLAKKSTKFAKNWLKISENNTKTQISSHKIYEHAYLSWKPSSLINCVSRLACSRTGSIITASIDFRSPNKYVYVLLAVSNICKEIRQIGVISYFSLKFLFTSKIYIKMRKSFISYRTCRKKKSLENGIRFEITGIDVILWICRFRCVWSVVLFSRRIDDWRQIEEIANLITCIQLKIKNKWWKW